MQSSSTAQSASTLHVSSACDLEKIRPMTIAVKDFLAEEGIGAEDLATCELALVEACNNAVLYATTEGRSQPVEVEVSCDDRQIEIKVHDRTAGFDPGEKVALPGDDVESGRGLFIIKSLMDDYCYQRGRDRNTFILRKFRPLAQLSHRRFPYDSIDQLHQKLTESEQIITDMTDELSSCYESLSAIFRAGAELGKTNNLREFSISLCKDLLDITAADWFVLRIVPKDEARLVVFASSARDLPPEPLTIGIFSDANPTAEIKAAVTGRDVWFDAQSTLEANDPLAAATKAGFGLVHPFFFCETLMGTLAVGKNTNRPPFTSAHTNVVHTFAEFLAIQIANARLREEQLRTRIVTHELEIAKGIQRALLPKSLPSFGKVKLAGYCESARVVGGDFYDVVQAGTNSLLLVIADVMGKGVPAAMFAAILRSMLRSNPELNTQPGALLTRINRLLYAELSEVDMFITAQLLFLDLDQRRIVVASAGHCPALIARPQEETVRIVSPEGLPIGILPDAVFTDHSEDFSQNARLLLYTDGLTETRNNSGEFFGNERLTAWFKKQDQADADELTNSLARELSNFRGHAALTDDQTFLIVTEQHKE